MMRHCLRSLLLVCALGLLAGCAAGPGSTSSLSATGSTVSGSTTSGGAGPLLQFVMTINDQGTLDGTNGLYVFLLNAFAEPIDVSSNDKFTDFMVWDGTNATWYHRQTNPQNNNYVFVPTANLNQALAISPDRRSFSITFNVADSSNVLNQFIATNVFTAHAMTTDRTGILGRVLDTMGPSLNQDTLYTYTVNKQLGAVTPLPPNYPLDSLNDWIIQPDLDPAYPYVNFDIKKFEVISK